jgi:hypothetical protein
MAGGESFIRAPLFPLARSRHRRRRWLLLPLLRQSTLELALRAPVSQRQATGDGVATTCAVPEPRKLFVVTA